MKLKEFGPPLISPFCWSLLAVADPGFPRGLGAVVWGWGLVLVMQQHSGILKKCLEEISPFCGSFDNIPWLGGISKSHFVALTFPPQKFDRIMGIYKWYFVCL